MTAKLYLVALPDAQTTTSREAVAAQIQQSGLLEGGTATEKIASENIDLVVNGQWRFGETFSKKLADELESLGESSYEGVVFYDPDATDSGRNKGYYELESVDVNPAHPSTRDTFEYTAALAFTGTRETHWRAVETNTETISTGLATGSGGLIGVPASAGKTRWFDTASGTEDATHTAFADAEYGTLKLFDPSDSSYTDPSLIYEAPFSAEGSVDVRVWDDLDTTKYATITSGGGAYDTGAYDTGVYGGTIEATQWVHAYHTAFEFDGRPIVDNGLIRVAFDETTGALEVFQWDDNSVEWSDVTPTQTDYSLIDADIERVGPALVDVYCEFRDSTSGSLTAAVLSIQRGLAEVVVRQPTNTTIPTTLENMLDPVSSSQSTDAQPTQTLKPRSEAK